MSDKVILRRWRGSQDLIALFPESPADEWGFEVNSYEHVGAHGPASYPSVLALTQPVREIGPDEERLLDELRRIGYEPEVYARETAQMRIRRRQEAARLRKASGDKAFMRR
jgi:hypothetical protein